jgi:hypothetical protein
MIHRQAVNPVFFILAVKELSPISSNLRKENVNNREEKEPMLVG